MAGADRMTIEEVVKQVMVREHGDVVRGGVRRSHASIHFGPEGAPRRRAFVLDVVPGLFAPCSDSVVALDSQRKCPLRAPLAASNGDMKKNQNAAYCTRAMTPWKSICLR